MDNDFKPRIVCAANRDATGLIVLGLRHFDAFMRGYYEKLGVSKVPPIEQGFVDQFGKFHTRKEAWVIAEAAGQIIRRVGGDGLERTGLFSENLY